MKDKLLIERELLEQVASEFEHDNDRYMLGRELRKVLDAPRQPEGEAASILLPALRQYMHNDGSGLLAGYEYERTQQIVAELREECERLRKDAGAEMFLTLTGEVTTLRQQLAERDAEIERLTEQSENYKGQFAELHAARNLLSRLSREGFDVKDAVESVIGMRQQRDKLAGLLQRIANHHIDGNIRPTVRDCVNGLPDVQDIYGYCDEIAAEIDAALAEVNK